MQCYPAYTMVEVVCDILYVCEDNTNNYSVYADVCVDTLTHIIRVL